MKRLNVVLFNEDYWNHGLIYTQNIRPLEEIRNNHPEVSIRVLSFSPIPLLLLQHKDIKKFKEKMAERKIKVIDYPVLFFPTRYLLLKWYIVPFFFLNITPYILYIKIKDIFSGNVELYNLRSNGSALAFTTLYRKVKRLFFDTRTDFIVEHLNQKYWEEGGLTDRLWRKMEKYIILHTNKTFFISDIQCQETLERYNLTYDSDKHVVIYNPADLNRVLYKGSESRKNDFVYSGSLGNWNNIQLYLDFFLKAKEILSDSKLHILTSTPRSKIASVYEKEKYDSIRSDVELVFNATEEQIRYYYGISKYGLQLMSKKDSRVGVKVVEYIVAGVIPIVSDNVMGAAKMVDKYNAGIIYRGKFDDEFISVLSNPQLENEIEPGRKELMNIVELNNYSKNLYKYYFDEV